MGIPPASVARQLFHPSGQDDELRVQSLHAGILRAGHVAMVGGMVMYGLYVLLLSLVCWCHYHHDQKDLNCESNHITSLTFFSSTPSFHPALGIPWMNQLPLQLRDDRSADPGELNCGDFGGQMS